jgi:hypothetical protein
MPQHTPGPWTVEDPMGPKSLWIVEAGKPTHEWRCIAMVFSDDPKDPNPILSDEQQANARLIALAPQLWQYVAYSASSGCATAKALLAKLEP